MGKKEDTPLQASVKENDTLKKSIDKFIKSSDTQLKKKNIDRREVKDLHERCNDHLTEVESQIQHVTELTLEDEPSMKESKFSVKKKDELKKLSTLKVKLENLEEKLKPDETEEGEMEKEQKEDSDEEDEETEDEEESGEEEESEMVVKGGKRGQSSARSDTKIEKRKEATEEVYGESEEEDLTGDEDDDEEDDMTDVTEEEETELKKPLPRKEAKSVEKPDPHQKQQEDYDKEIVKGKKAAAVKQQVEEDDDDDETEDEEDETKDEEDETEDEEEETEDETEAVGKDDAESDEELESEEDEEVEDTSPKGTNRQYEALVDFEGEQEGDLSFHAGEILTILSARSDGWLDAKNARGKQGLVPVTYLKVYNKYKSLEKPVAEDEEEESEVDSEGGEGTKTPRSGRKLWKNIKHAVKEEATHDIVTDLCDMLPNSLWGSLLGDMAVEEQCSMKAYLAPKLSPSCLSYRDLFIDSTTNRVRARASRILRIVQLVSARQIPAPGVGPDNKNPRTGLDIKSRHVRVCLFDGHSMLSNIHTMAVASVDKDQRTWHFSTKMNENMKSWEFGECFIRSNTTETNIGILFELCMSYVRRSNQQVGEFSCGWVFLPLYDKDGRPAEFKSYDEFVNGGTPFEKGVDVDPNVGRRENSGMFRYLVGGNKQPRLNFRLLSPTKDQKELLDTLPDILISSTVYIQYLSFYRQILTDSVIRDNEDLLTCDNIHNGVLTTFPAVTDQSDLMDVLRQSWAERMKAVKRADKRDADLMKEQFKKVFMESVYPLVYASTLPLYKPTEPQVMQVRSAEIKRILKVNKEKKFVASLLSSDTECKPFDVSELAFSVIGPYCVAQKHRVH